MADQSSAERRLWKLALGVCLAAALSSSCATTTQSIQAGERAEASKDYDRAVVEYSDGAPRQPRRHRRPALALERVKLRGAQEHAARGRRLAAAERYEEAVVEYPARGRAESDRRAGRRRAARRAAEAARR